MALIFPFSLWESGIFHLIMTSDQLIRLFKVRAKVQFIKGKWKMPHSLIMKTAHFRSKSNTERKHVFQLESASLPFFSQMTYLEHWKMLISELSRPLPSQFKIFILNCKFTFQASVGALQCLRLKMSQKYNYFVMHLNSEHVDEANYLVVLSKCSRPSRPFIFPMDLNLEYPCCFIAPSPGFPE